MLRTNCDNVYITARYAKVLMPLDISISQFVRMLLGARKVKQALLRC